MNENGIKLDDRLQPLPEGKLISIARAPSEKLAAYRDEGLLQISNGHVAVLLMAGGQGEMITTIPMGVIRTLLLTMGNF